MSTLPGPDSWRDTGLQEPDRHEREVRAVDPDDATDRDAANLLEEALTGTGPVAPEAAEEYRPRTARPDLDGQADEADVAEQAEEVSGLDEDDLYAAEAEELDTPEPDVAD